MAPRGGKRSRQTHAYFTNLGSPARKARESAAGPPLSFVRDATSAATVAQRELLARRRKLAADYAAGRADAAEVLEDLERPQIEGLLDDA